MAYKTTWEEHGIFWEYSGVLTSQDLIDSNYEFYNDSRADSALYQLSDFSNVEKNELDELTIERITAMDFGQSKSVSNIKAALVSSSAEAREEFQKHIELILKIKNPWTFKIFDNIESARKWIAS